MWCQTEMITFTTSRYKVHTLVSFSSLILRNHRYAMGIIENLLVYIDKYGLTVYFFNDVENTVEKV